MIETHLDPGGYADKELYTRSGDLLICLVQSGTLEMRIDDERILLHAGDAITLDISLEPGQITESVADTLRQILFPTILVAAGTYIIVKYMGKEA